MVVNGFAGWYITFALVNGFAGRYVPFALPKMLVSSLLAHVFVLFVLDCLNVFFFSLSNLQVACFQKLWNVPILYQAWWFFPPWFGICHCLFSLVRCDPSSLHFLAIRIILHNPSLGYEASYCAASSSSKKFKWATEQGRIQRVNFESRPVPIIKVSKRNSIN